MAFLTSCLLYLNLHTVLIFLAVYLVSYLYLERQRARACLPPGPASLPILGSLLALRWENANILEAFRSLRKRYGEVFTVMLGQRAVVMLASYEAIYEALVKRGKAFQGRPQDMLFIKELTKGQGIVSSQGHHWEEQRSFAHRVFREFGMGKAILEEKLHVELEHFVSWVRETQGRPFEPKTHIQTAVANVVTSIMFGRRHHYQDPKYKRHVAIMNRNAEIIGQCSILTVFPLLRFLPGDPFGFHGIKKTAVVTRTDYKESIDKHRAAGPNTNRADFLDAYLQEIEKNKDNPRTTFTDEQLLKVIADLYGAGIETTTTTLRWCLVYLLYNPEVMRRCQAEADAVVGSGRLPTMKDKVLMPFTEATILEVQRMADIIPLGVPHATMEDVQFRGYHIPKNTTVMINTYCVHRDPEVWDEPDRFRPERFLNEQGKVQHNKKLIPYSLGKRMCMGESLAKMELFLFFVTMVMHFDFESPSGSTLPDLDGILSMTKIPRSFEVIAKDRLSNPDH